VDAVSSAGKLSKPGKKVHKAYLYFKYTNILIKKTASASRSLLGADAASDIQPPALRRIFTRFP
jgi:hypothetical protein